MQNAKNTARSHKNSVKTTQNTQVFCIHNQKMLTPGIQTPIIQVTKGKGVLCGETPDQRYERL